MKKTYVILPPGSDHNPSSKYRVVKGKEMESYLSTSNKTSYKFKSFDSYNQAKAFTDAKIKH